MTEPTYEELKAKVAELEKKQTRQRSGALEFRVSEKGAVSVYGMGRFPVTLYREQWEKLLGMSDQIRQFIQENDHLLKKKEA
jgi:hypothetical protein